MKPLSSLLGFAVLWLVFITLTLGGGLLLVPVYWVLVFRGCPEREQRATSKLQGTLMAHEKVLGTALQLRICALLRRRVLLAATNSRMILIERSLFGGFTMLDYQWKDLRDVQLSENVLPQYFGSSLSFAVQATGKARHQFEIDGIESPVASKLYSEAQSQEQAWEEKRRVRELEEKRALAGGVHIGGTGAANSNASLEELERAKKLYDSGAVSDAEYQEIKAKILSRAG